MVIAVLADEKQKEELLSKTISPGTDIVWADSLRSLTIIEAAAYFDLLFTNDPERTEKLQQLSFPVFINSVISTLSEISKPFIRINAWPGMLERNILEIAVASPEYEQAVKNIFEEAGWKYQLVSDTTGMVTPRIISMIINEAWYTLGDNISTKEEIDTAMKLGTNYPAGPFEWGEKIGLDKVTELLETLSRSDARYTIAPSLKNKT